MDRLVQNVLKERTKVHCAQLVDLQAGMFTVQTTHVIVDLLLFPPYLKR